MRIRLFSALLLSLVVSACTYTSHDQYRGTLSPIPPIAVLDLEKRASVDDGTGKLECSEKLFRQRSIEKFRSPKGEVFTIGVIELSDDGHIKDIRQRDEGFRELRRVARGGGKATSSNPGAVGVTVVHGWPHRAKVCDENLSCYCPGMEGMLGRKED